MTCTVFYCITVFQTWCIDKQYRKNYKPNTLRIQLLRHRITANQVQRESRKCIVKIGYIRIHQIHQSTIKVSIELRVMSLLRFTVRKCIPLQCAYSRIQHKKSVRLENASATALYSVAVLLHLQYRNLSGMWFLLRIQIISLWQCLQECKGL